MHQRATCSSRAAGFLRGSLTLCSRNGQTVLRSRSASWPISSWSGATRSMTSSGHETYTPSSKTALCTIRTNCWSPLSANPGPKTPRTGRTIQRIIGTDRSTGGRIPTPRSTLARTKKRAPGPIFWRRSCYSPARPGALRSAPLAPTQHFRGFRSHPLNFCLDRNLRDSTRIWSGTLE